MEDIVTKQSNVLTAGIRLKNPKVQENGSSSSIDKYANDKPLSFIFLDNENID